MAYTDWLTRLLPHYFGPQFAEQRVRLMVTRSTLNEAFPDLGGANGFLKDMRVGPEWISPPDGTLRHRGQILYNQWEVNGIGVVGYPAFLKSFKNAPPFFPYLCLLCLAWTEGDDVNLAGHAFFARLSPLYPDHDLDGHLDEWECLWRGLQEWTERIDKKWGHFIVERLGGMIHVGVPKSQVIFTPQRIDRLSALFMGCSLQPNIPIKSSRLRDVLLANQQVTSQVLGTSLCREIERNTCLGSAALTLLIEHLENWDGMPPERIRNNTAGGPVASDTTGLVLVLEPTDDNRRWRVYFGVEENVEFEAAYFPHQNWKFTSVDTRLALATGQPSGFIDATTEVGHWTSGWVLNGRWNDVDGVADEAKIQLQGEGLRLFDKWVGPRLVESQGLPGSGGVYVLIGPQTRAAWENWLLNHCRNLPVQDFTWNGLPAGWHLHYLTNLEKLSESARDQFPGNEGVPTHHLRAIRLLGGTRANSSAARRVYADYDPPLLLMQAPRDARIELTGATHTELTEALLPVNMPGNIVRIFALSVEVGTSVVIAKVSCAGSLLGSVSFGVWRESGITSSEKGVGAALVDAFGNFCTKDGASGTIVPATYAQWMFQEGPHAKGQAYTPSVFEHTSFSFLESLFLNAGRIVFQEYRRRARIITKVEPWRLYDETRWLAQLAHVEIRSDSRGRWSHIYPNPFQLYLLPWTSKEKYQATLAGCGTIQKYKEIVAVAVDLDCEVNIIDNNCRLVPPSIILRHRELAAFDMLAKDFGLRWDRQPAAYLISNWANSLENWLSEPSRNWFDGEGPRPIAEYSPFEFRNTQKPFHAPYRLYILEDPYTRGHRWHTLVHNCALQGGGWRHAFVRDAAWGMWKAQNAIADGELSILPYDFRTGLLVVPCQLVFPYLLGRSLCLSSGLVPQVLSRSNVYMDSKLGVLPNESPPYEGACWGFQLIPPQIAGLVAKKVNAEIKSISI